MKCVCPDCKSETSNNVCPNCGQVLPIIVKDPKSKNYKERNAGKFSSLKQTKGLKPFSNKQRKKLSAYANSSSDQDCDEPTCAKCGCKENLTKHHPYGRSGQTEDGQDCITVWFWLCTSFGNRCHDWVHENPNEAMEQGWLQPEYRGQICNSPRKKPWK